MPQYSQALLQGLLNPAYQEGLFEAAKGLGQTPALMMAEKQRKEKQQKLADVYGSAIAPDATAEQMTQAARQLLEAGKVEEAMALAQQARAAQAKAAKEAQLQTLRESIAESASSLGLEQMAQRALQTTDEETLRSIQKDLRSYEREEIIRKRGIPGRKALAKNMGMEWDESMANMSDTAFTKLLEGSEATLQAFVNPKGQEMMLEVDSRGRVMDPQSGKYVRASQLGLRKAPNRQQIESIANYTNEKLAEAGVKRYDDLATAADDATKMMNNITEVLPNIDEMITGKLANAEVFVRGAKQAIASAVGLDPEDPKLENTQVFIALAAPRVATIIKDFGAGTGLSDADREFAQLAAGGDITMTANALRSILKILKNDADRTLSLFDTITDDIRKDKGQDPLIFYRIPALKSRPTIEQPTTTTPDATGLPDLPPGATLD